MGKDRGAFNLAALRRDFRREYAEDVKDFSVGRGEGVGAFDIAFYYAHFSVFFCSLLFSNSFVFFIVYNTFPAVPQRHDVMDVQLLHVRK